MSAHSGLDPVAMHAYKCECMPVMQNWGQALWPGIMVPVHTMVWAFMRTERSRSPRHQDHWG